MTNESTETLAIEVVYIDESGRLRADRTIVRDLSDQSRTVRFDTTDVDQSKR